MGYMHVFVWGPVKWLFTYCYNVGLGRIPTLSFSSLKAVNDYPSTITKFDLFKQLPHYSKRWLLEGCWIPAGLLHLKSAVLKIIPRKESCNIPLAFFLCAFARVTCSGVHITWNTTVDTAERWHDILSICTAHMIPVSTCTCRLVECPV